MNFDPVKECSFSATTSINKDLFRLLCGLSDVGSSCSPFALYSTKRVQVRRHRKKRINKKWAKKYGYRVIEVPLGDFLCREINSNPETQTYSFERVEN